MTSGGKRIGAGRKALPSSERKVQFSITVSPLTKEKWRDVRRYYGPEANHLVERYICRLFDKLRRSREK